MLTIPSHYVGTVLKTAGARQLDIDKILRDNGISPAALSGEQQVIHSARFVGLVQYLWQALDDEFLGFSATPCKPGLFALGVQYVSQFETLGAVLRELRHFYAITRDDVSIDINVDDNHTSLQVTLARPELDTDHYLVELLLVSIHRFICWISDKRIPLQAAAFSYRQPSHADWYGHMFPCVHRFKQPANELLLAKKYLRLPVVRNAQQVRDFLRRAPADLMLIPGDDDRYKTRVRNLLAASCRQHKPLPNLDSVAAALHVSPQTLRRRLREERSSYRRIKDATRRDLAIDKLVRGDIPLQEVGQQLGFAEPASFARAFKQWTGVSPAEYRLRSNP